MNLEPGAQLSHYRLLEKLGEGGMGVVWKACDLTLDRVVAVKFMPEGLAEDPARRARFEREAKAVAALHHPSIVTIFAIEKAEGFYFFTMEYVEGEPLTRLLASEGMPLDQFFKIALPLAEAVAAAHERGIIHRDLKPGNIMIDRSGRVKILDFGLAEIMDALSPLGAADKTLTATFTEGISGTILYMSPEQLRGETLDHRADLFSLGIILYEMAAGAHPFAGKTGADTIASILKSEPRPASELNTRLPRQLDRVLRHCLEKNIRLRMGTAVDLKDELARLQREGPESRSEELPSVGVLPFADMSREKDQSYFCEGIAEEITNAEGKANTYLIKGINNYYRFAVFVNGTAKLIYPNLLYYTSKTNFIVGVTETV
ncbi:MAG: serine/threonine-protein kinase, partial [Candidatus Aminicenantes bacterium]|nr:serine/threonine-protein kinase [Candidatus Aminicenantes bacterium]